MKEKITFTKLPSSKDIEFLSNNLSNYAFEKKSLFPIESFAFFIHDENENTIGGINGHLFYGCLYIDQLFILKEHRSKGLGKILMDKTEKHAMDNRCLFMSVNTMDWEAEDFYKKCGFKVEFERKGFEKNSSMIFLRKDLHHGSK